MRVASPIESGLVLIFFVKFTRSDLLTDKSRVRGNCTNSQVESCLPGRCKVAPRESPELYTCICPRTTYLTRRFNPQKESLFQVGCASLPYDPCMVCHERNTVRCTQVSPTEALCQCYSEYSTATNCHKQKNPCLEVPLGASLSGAAACKTDEGNLCIPELGTERYTCVCLHPFQSSKTQTFPNCLGEPEKLCDRQLCVGFRPFRPKGMTITPQRVIVTKDLDSTENEHAICAGNGSCRCPSNWYGEHCTRRKGKPRENSWTTWSPCHPDCLDTSILSAVMGVSGVGYKISKAICTIQEPRFCEGKFRTWIRCKVTSLCIKENQRFLTFPPDVALAATKALKPSSNKHASAQTGVPASLFWNEKQCLFTVFISVTVLGSVLSVIFMEIITAIRMPKEEIRRKSISNVDHQ
ncbi:hypothetical protein EGR_02123 [Echinococcus granulosus]|uniref:EGF-like domain-containing protein n=1 Tax=Echinococcus granulosus TaxID=6210 RepID=W6V909_ECHGR|nr:hypothetical protein EGR_02123 [Echinococcus granulosus]EUB63029.1 hypothetical protein EGR_02123 [Echinococcus granulosus]